MAATIKTDGSVKTSNITSAINSLDTAANILTSTYTTVSGADFISALINGNIFGGSRENLRGELNNIKKISNRLSQCKQILQSGPKAIEEVDAGFGKKSSNTWSGINKSLSNIEKKYNSVTSIVSLFTTKKTASTTKVCLMPSTAKTNTANQKKAATGTVASTKSSKWLSTRKFNGSSYQCLSVKNDYPDQAPGQCWANCVSISKSIMKSEGVSGSRKNAAFSCSTMAEDISNGKPVLLHFLHDGSGGEHWIVAVGIKDGSSEPYDLNDFLYIDAYDGKLCEWSKFSKSKFYKNARPKNLQRYA